MESPLSGDADAGPISTYAARADPLEARPASELTLDELIAELDAPYPGRLPRRALREAQQRRDEIVPRLIELIRRAVAEVRARRKLPGDGHLFALYLLTEFRAVEALPAIMEAISLDKNGPEALFGDAIGQDLRRILATLAGDTPEVIDALAADPAIDEYVRWAAAGTYLLLVRDGRLTREQAVERLRRLLIEAVAQREHVVAAGVICELTNFAPAEARDEIRAAYRSRQVDESIIDLREVEKAVVRGTAGFERALQQCAPTAIDDTVAELEWWASFREDDGDVGEEDDQDVEDGIGDAAGDGAAQDDDEYSDLPALDDEFGPGERLDEEALASGPAFPLRSEPQNLAPDTIRHEGPRVGRNEPCPCGSGKKFKRCCGRH